ncbi:MAG TPA: pantoate--beta-alanine ligase [Acidiphilium sp.]|nr:MAG: pantoate--beta-alanine ligase [Acidiphilium sp. 21-60-14]OYV90900.1 MAG: pantoate--beta-alanine ligase [Acidiphilium sp. 37-60-79]HQT88294.1 pantoate--beta-alanine ligase [Acidiphilium sp.]HQU23343.1 pantoate--beta-alanine ligase [Acidiphilium sp.]
MIIARTIEALDAARTTLGPLALVPTMGALHAGHVSLVAAAHESGLAVAASIFVNPLQFGPNEDFARYPRDEAADLAALRAAGCALAWLPDASVMYPSGDATVIEVAGPAQRWEGAARPSHFRGVATVVAKLFGQIRPERAYFGEKDWQQVQVVSRMARDLALPVTIVTVPTMREPDGLALSSRNRYLAPEERRRAAILPATLQDLRAELQNDAVAESATAAALERAHTRLRDHGFAVDYVALVDAVSLEPITCPRAGSRLLAAARLGAVRLLDTMSVDMTMVREEISSEVH